MAMKTQASTDLDAMPNQDSATAVPGTVPQPLPAMTRASLPQISRIETHEEAEARALIDELCPHRPSACGYYILVKTHIRSDVAKEVTTVDGGKASLYVPQSVQTSDQFNSIAALVLDVGPIAYDDDEKFGKSGPWCKPGDWILVPRHEGFNFSYRGIAMQLVPDDKILGVIDDPNDVTPTHFKDLT